VENPPNSRPSLLASCQRDWKNVSRLIPPSLFGDPHAALKWAGDPRQWTVNEHGVRDSSKPVTAFLSGMIAGTLATLMQRCGCCGRRGCLDASDARCWLTAALVPGEKALSPSAGFEPRISAAQGFTALSVIYAALLLPVARRMPLVPSLLAGAGLGALLYFVNLHGFTVIFLGLPRHAAPSRWRYMPSSA
jgi:hypothetical protein